MDAGVFLRRFVIGFSIAALVGPIGVLCIRRTSTDGRAAGCVSGLGTASADAVYGSIAACGLTVVSGFLIGQQVWLRLIGACASTFLLTLTNPMTILSSAAIFAGLGLAGMSSGFAAAGFMVAGGLLGSAAWRRSRTGWWSCLWLAPAELGR
ncbi:MAG: hypothetical protein QN131_11775 [Armatimonadota bacterium]|nr:hypothetical protein [Armatimonadota bacterium]MDR7550597.1 hypothetical protein [Armatimonadota bacterium]